MCDSCGCGDASIVPLEVQARILAGNEKVLYLGVSSYGDVADKLAAYAKEKEIKYSLCHDEGKAIAKVLGAKRVNSAFVFAKGKLFWSGGMTAKGDDPHQMQTIVHDMPIAVQETHEEALAGLEDCGSSGRPLFFTTDDGDARAFDVYTDWPLCEK